MKTKLFILLVVIAANAHSQIITTFAGNGLNGTTGDGGPATNAKVGPYACSFDKFGNLYICQINSCVVRKVDTGGIITKVAGTGIIGYAGDGGQATAARLSFPTGVTCDSSGNLYISDHQNYRIRKVDRLTGIISTYAGSGIIGDAGDGGLATAAKFFPGDIHFDNHNNLYITDNTFNKIRVVYPSGFIATYAGTGSVGFSGDGGLATMASLNQPGGITIDDIGNVYFADAGNKRIRRIDTFGIITTFAGTGVGLYLGDGSPATGTSMGPLYVTIDRSNNIYFSDSNSRVRKINAMGIVETIAGTGIDGFNGDGILATTAQVYTPGGISVDLCGNVFFCDNNNFRVRKVAMPPILTVPTISLSGSSSYPVGGTVSVTAAVGSAGSSYIIHWLNNGLEFTTTTVPMVTYTKGPGIDTITARVVPTGYGCWDSTTSPNHIIYTNTTGVYNVGSSYLMIYPNPAHNTITIVNAATGREAMVTDMVDRQMLRQPLSAGETTIDIARLPAGIYIIKVEGDGEQMITRIVKE